MSDVTDEFSCDPWCTHSTISSTAISIHIDLKCIHFLHHFFSSIHILNTLI